MEVKKSKLSCSFCGKQQSKVKKLIAGPNIYICNECVDLCNDILVEEEKSEADQSFQIAKPKEIYTLLDEICLLYTSPSPRDRQKSRMPSSA